MKMSPVRTLDSIKSAIMMTSKALKKLLKGVECNHQAFRKLTY